MKKFAILAALMVSTVGAFAQGTIFFQNTAASVITWAPGGPNSGNVAGTSGIKIGLYYNGALVPLPSGASFPIAGTSSTGAVNPALNGRFTLVAPSTLTIPGLAGGASGTSFQVKAWAGNYTSYEAAVAGGELQVGFSAIFTNPSGGLVDPVTQIPGAAASLTGFQGLQVQQVPEPSTLVLAALGIGALSLIRRRK